MIESKKLENGFEYLEITNNSASAKIALQGAHIFYYKCKNEDSLLWLSQESDFEYGKAIRGGIPICWPWFGMPTKDKNLPQHGFARTSVFELIHTIKVDDDTTFLQLRLKDSKQTLSLWPYKFELIVEFTISDKLIIELKTKNVDTKMIELTQALHTYFNISDISQISIDGLNDKPYLDALDFNQYVQDGKITFNKEIDRVYQNVKNKILLIDKNRTIKIQNSGSASVVVWNPWIDKCKRMNAMSETAYKEFVCIESSNAFDDMRVIERNGTHTLKAIID